MRFVLNIGRSHAYLIAALLVAVVSVLVVIATGYTTGDASHSTLFTNSIRAKAGGTVAVDDNLEAQQLCFASDCRNSWGSIGVPSGAVMHFNLATCPTGWTELTTARGRYLVGRPVGGALGQQVGTALTNGESRPAGQHTHGVRRSWVDSTGSPALIQAGPNYIYLQDLQTFTDGGSGLIAGTNAPYIQLLVCQKN